MVLGLTILLALLGRGAQAMIPSSQPLLPSPDCLAALAALRLTTPGRAHSRTAAQRDEPRPTSGPRPRAAQAAVP